MIRLDGDRAAREDEFISVSPPAPTEARASRSVESEKAALEAAASMMPVGGYEPEREIRFALVMYGGVSLAIYMYGVALELLNLVKATAPAVPGNTEPGDLAFPDDPTTLPVYRKLARLLGAEGGEDAGPVRVRFVVDLISGTSAGGLNGVCLAAVLANDRPGSDPSIEGLEQLWVRHGGLETLLAGDESALDDAGAIDKRLQMAEPPPSLLNGARFYKLLAETLTDQLSQELGKPGADSRLVDQLDLWVTATDLVGRHVTLPIKNTTVSERQHAYRFHFVYDPKQSLNDLSREVAPFLAFAGRASSSFPVAFEPIRLGRIEPFHPIALDWQKRFFADFEPGAFEGLALSDGGILDNKPFSYATQDLIRRPASLPVDRYLLYVEPDPKPAATQDETDREWTAFETASAALTGIPRSETIREDLELVQRRNRMIRRARRFLSETSLSGAQQLVAPRIERNLWRSMGVAQMIAAQPYFGPTYPVYHRLKVSTVCEYLARLLTRSLGLDEHGDDLAKLRALVDVWKRDRYQPEPKPKPNTSPAEGFPLTESEFLFRFDMPFRIRRVTYLLGRLRDLESGDQARVKRVFDTVGCAPLAVERSELRGFRKAVSAARNGLLEVEQQLPLDAELRRSLELSGVKREVIEAMSAEDEEQLLAQVPDGIATRGNPLDVIVDEAVRNATDEARSAIEDALGTRHGSEEEVAQLLSTSEPDLRRVLRLHYDTFEAYDLIYLPLSYETAAADTNEVSIIRISPLDANRPPCVSRALKGAGLHHFGAFTDASWRRHDIAWGRLNAAEILIRNLLPDKRGDALVEEAQAVIVKDYVAKQKKVGEDGSGTAADGTPLLGGARLTTAPPTKRLLRRLANIASDSMQKQLKTSGAATPAKAVRLGAEAAKGATISRLLAGLYGLLPARGKVIAWVIPLLLVFAATLLVLAGEEWIGALLFGLILGAFVFLCAAIAVARSRIGGAVDAALDRFERG